jgi:hypothetical protein
MRELNDNAALTVELVGAFAKEIATIGEVWERADLGIRTSTGNTEVKASYVGPTGVSIVNVLEHKAFFHWAPGTAARLFDTLEAQRPVKVALVVLNSDLSYELMYEYDDPNRWAISKLNGGTSVHSGL